MLTVWSFFKKRADLSHQDFLDHWTQVHPDFVRSLPGLKRYVQHRPVPERTQAPPAFDCFVELVVQDIGSLRRLPDTGPYANLIEDEARFLDRSSMQLLLTEELRLSKSPMDDGLEKIGLLKRAAAWTPQQFQLELPVRCRDWLTGLAHAPGLRLFLPRLAGYDNDRKVAWDAVVVMGGALKEEQAPWLTGACVDPGRSVLATTRAH
ncbi:MAG: hypothetical protein EOO22_10910, partial [Comamonadaceae bacterium]